MKSKKKSLLSKFLKRSAKLAGHPLLFVTAFLIVTIWFLFGLFIGFSEKWFLIINTIATIIAFLMVIIIQNTQIRESKALHLKIDELILVTKEADNKLIAIEEKEEEEIERIRRSFFEKPK